MKYVYLTILSLNLIIMTAVFGAIQHYNTQADELQNDVSEFKKAPIIKPSKTSKA